MELFISNGAAFTVVRHGLRPEWHSLPYPFNRGFYLEPKRVLHGTQKGSTWNPKGFSCGNRNPFSKSIVLQNSFTRECCTFCFRQLFTAENKTCEVKNNRKLLFSINNRCLTFYFPFHCFVIFYSLWKKNIYKWAWYKELIINAEQTESSVCWGPWPMLAWNMGLCGSSVCWGPWSLLPWNMGLCGSSVCWCPWRLLAWNMDLCASSVTAKFQVSVRGGRLVAGVCGDPPR